MTFNKDRLFLFLINVDVSDLAVFFSCLSVVVFAVVVVYFFICCHALYFALTDPQL